MRGVEKVKKNAHEMNGRNSLEKSGKFENQEQLSNRPKWRVMRGKQGMSPSLITKSSIRPKIRSIYSIQYTKA